MNLYLIEQSANNDWDTYDSAVVCAESPEQATRIDPGGLCEWSDRFGCWVELSLSGHKTKRHNSEWVNDLNFITCEYLGPAKDKLQKGVILASFNAG